MVDLESEDTPEILRLILARTFPGRRGGIYAGITPGAGCRASAEGKPGGLQSLNKAIKAALEGGIGCLTRFDTASDPDLGSAVAAVCRSAPCSLLVRSWLLRSPTASFGKCAVVPLALVPIWRYHP